MIDTSLFVTREALVTDAERISHLEWDLFPDNWLSDFTIQNEMERGPAFVCAARAGIISAYALTSYREGILDLLRLGVARGAQGHGLGQALLERVLLVPHRECILTVRKHNSRAVRLYTKLGFLLFGEAEDAWVLTRTSTQPTAARR